MVAFWATDRVLVNAWAHVVREAWNNGRVILFSKPSPDRLQSMVGPLAGVDFTYPEVGASAHPQLPEGYHVLRDRFRLCSFSNAAFAAAVSTMKDWGIQRGSGLLVAASGPVETNAVLAQAASLPVMGFVIATCRVVYVEESETSFAYAYGTLAEHPESGEERFCVRRDGDDLVFEITAFSKPHGTLVKLAGPMAWVIQRRATNAYGAAMVDAVKSVS